MKDVVQTIEGFFLNCLVWGINIMLILGLFKSSKDDKKVKKYYVYDDTVDEFVEVEKNKLVRR